MTIPYLLDSLGRRTVANDAGGQAFAVSDRVRLERFLILGGEGGTYYVKERDLLKENRGAVDREIRRDGRAVVALVADISDKGRAPKNDPALFVLALAAKQGDELTRKAAFQALPRVARTLTHLYHWAAFVNALGGWGRGTRRAVAEWFNGREAGTLAHQLVKYQRRDGWAAADLLRLAHPKPVDFDHDLLYRLACYGAAPCGDPAAGPLVPRGPAQLGLGSGALDISRAAEAAKMAVNEDQVAELVAVYGLPREAVPSRWLTSPVVWAALLPNMGATALLRNLGTMSKLGLLTSGSMAEGRVLERLGDAEYLKRGRVHPVHVLTSMLTYRSGHGHRSDATWAPVTRVVDALDAAFYASFGTVVPSGGRTLLGLDVSGSMSSPDLAGVPGLSPRVGAVAMAMVTQATEPQTVTMAFCDKFVPLDVSPRRRLDDNVAATACLPFGGTDCALPMIYAGIKGLEIDTFVIYTDSETWAGDVSPHRALAAYRAAFNPQAKLVVVGMTSTGFSLADPNDAGMLDVVGFDTTAPQAIADFAAGWGRP